MPNDQPPTAVPCPKCGNGMKPCSKTPGGKVRWECRRREGGQQIFCYSTTSPGSGVRSQNGDIAPPAGQSKVFKRKLKNTQVYIITAAQNATPVHPVFWNCLLRMQKHRRGELLVKPFRYKNPTSRWEDSQANADFWVEEVGPYLWNVQKVLNQNLVFLADLPIQPTASNPLSGCDSLSGSSSAIIGHSKLQLRCIPTPSNRMAKIVATTGACTVPNYTDSKAGRLGNFHHTLAALVVEIVGKKFFLRQLNFDTKTQSFTDLGFRYYEDRVEKAPRAAALVMGDTHTDFISKGVEVATFGPGGMVDVLKPEHLVWHDLLDGYAVNPHHKGNPFNSIAKVASGRSAIKAEVERACHYVKNHTPADTVSVIVPSNHDDFLRRWIVTADWKTEPGNALFYLETAAEMVRRTRFVEGFGTWYPSPFPMIFRQTVDCSNVELLESDPERPEKNFNLAGIELSMHGDRGPNGSRGSIQNHKRIGVRSIIGHSHTPGIEEGAYQCGTSTNLRLEYTGGPSSWLNCHCVINADGKRQLIIIVDGKWRA